MLSLLLPLPLLLLHLSSSSLHHLLHVCLRGETGPGLSSYSSHLNFPSQEQRNTKHHDRKTIRERGRERERGHGVKSALAVAMVVVVVVVVAVDVDVGPRETKINLACRARNKCLAM